MKFSTVVPPGVTVTVLSRTSHEIERGIEEFELDAGLTYLAAEPIGRLKTKPICIEEYSFLTPATNPLAGRAWPFTLTNSAWRSR